MTHDEFKRLPLLLRRSQVMELLNLSPHSMEALVVEMEDEYTPVPFGKIGAVRTPSKEGTKSGYRRYRRDDIARILGEPYRT